MKIATLTAIAAAGLLPIAALAQIPPTPPAPPAPPAPAIAPAPPMGGDHDRDRGPKVPVTYLGVETSSVPNVVSEQLGLAKGFGLVVDYVVPDGPAAVAGVQPNDILKMFNDQILTEPDQLAKLVRSNAEGASVTLTVLRKGAETKLTAKLAKKEVPQRRGPGRHDFGAMNFHDMDFGKLKEELSNMRDEMGNMNFGFNSDTADQIREQVGEARDAARDAVREGARAAREGARDARRAAREMRIAQHDNGSVKTTRIDMGRAQIVYHDAQGELKIENAGGKKVLTAKDPEGRLVFSGPVETKEELDKMPPEVRQRYEKLEQKDLPNVVPPNVVSQSPEDTEDSADVDDDEDADSGDNDADDADESTESVIQVLFNDAMPVPYRRFGINTVVI